MTSIMKLPPSAQRYLRYRRQYARHKPAASGVRANPYPVTKPLVPRAVIDLQRGLGWLQMLFNPFRRQPAKPLMTQMMDAKQYQAVLRAKLAGRSKYTPHQGGGQYRSTARGS